VEAEGLGAGDDFLADLADADDAEGFAEDAVGFGEFFFIPFVAAEGGDIFGDAAVEGEDEGHGEFSDGDGIFAGAVGDEDAAVAGGLDVDGIDAGTGAEDEGEVGGGGDDLSGDLFAADDEDFVGIDDAGRSSALTVDCR
jgi:hypothetical protein